MKIQLILLLSFLCSFTSPTEGEKVRIKNFEIEIPEALDRMTANPKYNELLSLKYKNELKILITDDIGSPDKTKERKEMYKALDLMKAGFEIKYSGWYSEYKGYDKGVLKKGKINSFDTISRDFKSNINGRIFYFKISTINIGNYYFDIIVTGKEDSRKSHQAIVNNLVNSIKKISEN